MRRARSRVARWAGIAAAAGLFVSCGRARPPAVLQGSWDYVVTAPAAGSWELAVEATFRGAGERLVAADQEDAFSRVTLVRGSADAESHALVPFDAGAWTVPSCRDACRIRYVVDLHALAASCARLDCGRLVGDAVLSQASAWMLRPEPAGPAVVHVRIAGDRFATGLRRDPAGGYVFRSEDLGEASYTVFGTFRRVPIDVGGATLEVVLLAQPVKMGDAAVVEWVRGAAGLVAGLHGRFPVSATVFVVPVPGADEVVFGRVMSLAGASMVLLVGAETRPESAHEDWVVVHELFHLSTPSFVGEGHWLEEGLATYYEPILRARAGWLTEQQLWRDFVRQMPRGLRKDGDPPSLEERDDIDSTYWGGALFAFLADLRLRQATARSAQPRSLDDVMRALLAERGDATHRASLADFVETADRLTGDQTLGEIYRSWAVRGEPVDLDATWRSLGIEVTAERDVKLHDDAPLATTRTSIAGIGH
jgi:predicted metalloprotease with PDZ domain